MGRLERRAEEKIGTITSNKSEIYVFMELQQDAKNRSRMVAWVWEVTINRAAQSCTHARLMGVCKMRQGKWVSVNMQCEHYLLYSVCLCLLRSLPSAWPQALKLGWLSSLNLNPLLQKAAPELGPLCLVPSCLDCWSTFLYFSDAILPVHLALVGHGPLPHSWAPRLLLCSG